MRTLPLVVLFFLLAAVAFAQTPQAAFSYEDRAGTTGHTLVVDGKSFGPYKDVISMTYSLRGKTAVFLVNKRDKTYILAQGKEYGPFPAGFSEESIWLSDDGKLWAISLVAYPNEDEGDSEEMAPMQVQLMVNGKTYGTYQAVSGFDYAESGGSWIASLQVSEEEYTVLLNGKTLGTFQSISNLWMSPDGKNWGYAGYKDADHAFVVTQDQTYNDVQEYNVYSLNYREPHWAYSVRTGEEDETVVVDGKVLTNYLHFEGLQLSPSGRHWGFGAQKLTDTGDYPVVVVDGNEFVGEGLSTNRSGTQEFFAWTVRDGNKTIVQIYNVN